MRHSIATEGAPRKHRDPVLVRVQSVQRERRRLSSSSSSSQPRHASSSSSSTSSSGTRSEESDNAASDSEEDDADPALVDSTLAVHIPHWAQHCVEEPSVLSLSDNARTIHGHDGSDYHTNYYPMHFAESVRLAPDAPPTAWHLVQGGDPVVHPHVRRMLEQQLKPLIVIRLNTFEPSAPLERMEDYYGPRCRRVFYVNDMSPTMIKDYVESDGDSVRTIHALAIILGDMYEGLVKEMESLMLREPWTGPGAAPPAVYLHCRMGLERSRYMFIALHGLFYANHAVGEHRDALVDAFDAWAARQALFIGKHLTLRALLTVDAPTMFTSLAHTLAALFGVRRAELVRRLMAHEPHDQLLTKKHKKRKHKKKKTIDALLDSTTAGVLLGVVPLATCNGTGADGAPPATKKKHKKGSKHSPPFQTRRERMRTNVMNVCAAGAGCHHREDHLRLMCMGCHSAFFCSLECVNASNHLVLYCPKYYDTDMRPLFLVKHR